MESVAATVRVLAQIQTIDARTAELGTSFFSSLPAEDTARQDNNSVAQAESHLAAGWLWLQRRVDAVSETRCHSVELATRIHDLPLRPSTAETGHVAIPVAGLPCSFAADDMRGHACMDQDWRSCMDVCPKNGEEE